MSAVGLFVRALRLGRNMDREHVAQSTGLSADDVRRHENGQAPVTVEQQRRYARTFGFVDLLSFQDEWRSHAGKIIFSATHDPGQIPVVNLAPAGPPRNYEEYGLDSGQGYTYVDRHPGQLGDNLFGVVIVGDSMTCPNSLDSINEGDLVICRPVQRVEDVPEGAAVFARFGWTLNNACTIKRLYHVGDGRIELRPANPRHASMETTTDAIARVGIIIETRKAWHAPSKTGPRIEGDDEGPDPRVVHDEFSQVPPGE